MVLTSFVRLNNDSIHPNVYIVNRQLIFLNSIRHHTDLIAAFDRSFPQHNGKYALPGHHAVSDLPPDGAVGVTLFSDLGNLQQRIPYCQPRANRQRTQLNSSR